MKEYEIISKFFSPLTTGFKGSQGLQDDVAYIPKDSKTNYLITTDSMLEGTHFLENSIPEAIAARLLASNLSDIASSGGVPKYYLLNGSISSRTDEKWFKDFADKAKRIQEEYKIHLIGGDTIRSDDKLYFSATVIGEIPKTISIARTGAKAGDDIYVSGTIGDAYLGLQILKGKFEDLSYEDKNYLINRYVDPKPRIELGVAISPFASACTDISDGFIIDMENICKSSNLRAEINKYMLPVYYEKPELFDDLISGGDDYELIFTVPKEKSSKISKIIKDFDLKITKIGKMLESDESKSIVTLLQADGSEYKISKKGYEHEV